MNSGENICKLDMYWRIAIPSKLVKKLNWTLDDHISFVLKDDSILLTKAERVCMFCGGLKDVVSILDKSICKECALKIKNNQPLTNGIRVGESRTMDTTFRIVMPKEMLIILDIKKDDPMELLLDEDSLIIKKQIPTCVFCKGSSDLHYYRGRCICAKCSNQIHAVFCNLFDTKQPDEINKNRP